MKIGVLLSRVRVEEKLLFEALERRHQVYERIDDRESIFDLTGGAWEYDGIIIRCISESRGLYASGILNSMGVPTVNSHEVIANCGDKVVTTNLLVKHHLPTPQTMVAFTPEAALAAIEEMGYPIVMKPVVGSWGRLLAKINDREAAEALLEHKDQLGSYQHSIYYVQKYVQKPGRDIRVVVVDGEPVAAMYRNSEHWITNAARGSKTVNCPISQAIGEIAVAAAKAVGGGAVAVDLFEGSNELLLVNEVNGTMEFKACTEASGVDIAGHFVDYALKVARKHN